MSVNGWIQIAIYFAVLTALVVPLGRYMASVFEGERTLLMPVLGPVERGLYRISGIDEAREQHWITYTVAMLLSNAAGFALVYALLRLQAWLPLNPAGMSAVAPDLAFNTAVSFVSNTNWQTYGGETTLVVSHPDGRVDHPELRLGSDRYRGGRGGHPRLRANGRQDRRQLLDRSHPQHPLRAAAAVDHRRAGPRVAGCAANLDAYVDATTLDGGNQTLSQGPAASQIAIKQLGTNGGGFFNVNSALLTRTRRRSAISWS